MKFTTFMALMRFEHRYVLQLLVLLVVKIVYTFIAGCERCTRGKYALFSSAAASSSSSFQSLVVSHSLSNSMSIVNSASPPVPTSVSGINVANCESKLALGLCEIGCTQRRSRNRLCRSLSSSIRLTISFLSE